MDMAMAYVVMAYIGMAYIVMADMIMAYIVMAYVVMAYAVMVDDKDVGVGRAGMLRGSVKHFSHRRSPVGAKKKGGVRVRQSGRWMG